MVITLVITRDYPWGHKFVVDILFVLTWVKRRQSINMTPILIVVCRTVVYIILNILVLSLWSTDKCLVVDTACIFLTSCPPWEKLELILSVCMLLLAAIRVCHIIVSNASAMAFLLLRMLTLIRTTIYRPFSPLRIIGANTSVVFGHSLARIYYWLANYSTILFSIILFTLGSIQ